MNIIKQRISELRAETGLSQDKFAKTVGESREIQQKYEEEKGTKNIPVEYLKKVCDEYHVTLDWLCGRSEYKNDKDLMASIIIALDKIIKVGCRKIHNDDYIYEEPVLWIDKNFAKYLQKVRELQQLRSLKKISSFSQLYSDMQEEYKEYFKELFGEEASAMEADRFNEIEAVEIAEYLPLAYLED